MSERSGSPSDEGEGDDLRPRGDDHDSSEESEDDPEEARRIADGFIVDDEGDNEDNDEDIEKEEDPEERRRRRKARKEEKKRKRRREREKRKDAELELSEDELELINENRGISGTAVGDRPLKRLKRRSGSPDENGGERSGVDRLKDMFADDEDRLDDDDDDLGSFIEEDEEPVVDGETEEERRQRKKDEKAKRRAEAKSKRRPNDMNEGAWNEMFDVFGDGHEYEWAMEGEDAYDDEYQEESQKKKELKLEDVFDPSEIKARLLQDVDKLIAGRDIPERHQLQNSTLSDNPVLAPTDILYPPPELASDFANNKISARTQYLFLGMENSYPLNNMNGPYKPISRPDLEQEFKTAVTNAIHMMFVEQCEVPYIWHYKRDALSKLENEGQSSVQFLERDELWTLYNLGIKFRAVYERIEQVRDTWNKIQSKKPELKDDYLTQTLLSSILKMGIEAASDGVDWLNYKYHQEIRQIKEEEELADAENATDGDRKAKKLPERAAHDELRSGPIMKLVEAFGMDVSSIAVDFNVSGGATHPPKDVEKSPLDLAEEFAGDGTPYLSAEDALKSASNIIVNEMAKDPCIRQQTREFMSVCGVVTVEPTERGMTVIDDLHIYWTFKFLTNKPAREFVDTPQWLHILKAEEEGLVKISIDVSEEEVSSFVGALEGCCTSEDYGETAKKWNELRKEICRDAVVSHLKPMASRWLKESLRGEAEDFIAERCRQELEYRINVKPFCGTKMEPGEIPSVLALTNGRGDVRDAIIAVMLDDDSSIRTQTKFDNLREDSDREALMDLIERRRPQVIVIGGLSVQTARLRDDVQAIIQSIAAKALGENPPHRDNYSTPEEHGQAMDTFNERLRPYLTPMILPSDATARLYMNSDEAAKEHPTLPVNGRYALALARYVQNPLNAYARLGRKMLDITFTEHHQKLISQEKLLIHLERGLVNAVCFMGIEITSCVADPYQRAMLPFIAGLGPRKADYLVQSIQSRAQIGALMNRLQLQGDILGEKIFDNVAGFLSIQPEDLDNLILEERDPQDQYEPLDCTRIHPADYDFARKMCQDALDLDVEDVEGQHPSDVVLKLMLDSDHAKKLGELNLDDFAFNLQNQGEGNKRYALQEIVNELNSYRADRRPDFHLLNPWEIVTMLTGETEHSIGRGMKVTANVRRVIQMKAFCVLDSGIDAIIDREYVADEPPNSCEDLIQSRQSVTGVVIDFNPQRFQAKLSLRPQDLSQAVTFMQPFIADQYNDENRRLRAEEALAAKKRRSAGKIKRVVNHPNWHVMNSGQAELFLASLPRGEVVIRPSSKGNDHLALTFKLGEEVYQHVDIQEIDKPNEYSLGKILRIAGRYSFGDLDDVIVNYVNAVMRMVYEAERNEKFRPEEDLEEHLKNTLNAFPTRSMYGFCLDHDRPGYLRLCFLNKSTRDGGQIQSWPVRILPGAFALNNAEVPGMLELCNAFKAQYSNRLLDQGAGGKTPGIRVGRTPAQGGRTPGGRTPGMGGATPYGAGMAKTPIRPGMTPNPYGGASVRPVNAYGGATPSYQPPMPQPMAGGYQGRPGMPPQPPQGYGNGGGPGYPPMGPPMGMPPRPPNGAAGMGMNPERAAMLRGGRY